MSRAAKPSLIAASSCASVTRNCGSARRGLRHRKPPGRRASRRCRPCKPVASHAFRFPRGRDAICSVGDMTSVLKNYSVILPLAALVLAFWFSPDLQEVAAGVAIFLFGILMLQDGFKAAGRGQSGARAGGGDALDAARAGLRPRVEHARAVQLPRLGPDDLLSQRRAYLADRCDRDRFRGESRHDDGHVACRGAGPEGRYRGLCHADDRLCGRAGVPEGTSGAGLRLCAGRRGVPVSRHLLHEGRIRSFPRRSRPCPICPAGDSRPAGLHRARGGGHGDPAVEPCDHGACHHRARGGPDHLRERHSFWPSARISARPSPRSSGPSARMSRASGWRWRISSSTSSRRRWR